MAYWLTSMEARSIRLFFLFYFVNFVCSQDDVTDNIDDLTTTKVSFLEPVDFVNWPNGTIPFYINEEHFDNEQSLIIMTSLSLIAFKTCLKFTPVMVPPEENQHVLTFVNPTGVKKCELQHSGHARTEPHVVQLGYDCLQAPWMDRIVLRSLGLPLEHNRANRDHYIDVQFENIEQNEIPLFTKDYRLPAALRALPYDINSVLHFGDRDYSKNGHRTIIFKDRNTKQKWEGVSELDLRKIQIIYGPECTKRDRQEKLDLCSLYPGIPPVNRRKRAIDASPRSLRVNPDITLPPEPSSLNISHKVEAALKTLDIKEEVQGIVDSVFKLSNKALNNARKQHCNDTTALRSSPSGKSDVLGVVEVITDYAQSVVDLAANDLTAFCERSESVDKYQRQRCPDGCYRQYPSTKHYQPYISTKHRPEIRQSTWHVGGLAKRPYGRSGNHTDANTEVQQKLQVEDTRNSKEQNAETAAMKSDRVKRGAREGKRRRWEVVGNKEKRRYSSEEDRRPSSVERNRKKDRKKRLGSEEKYRDNLYGEDKQKDLDSYDDNRKPKKEKRPAKSEEKPREHLGGGRSTESESDERRPKKEFRPDRPAKFEEKSPEHGGKESSESESESDDRKPKKEIRPPKSDEGAKFSEPESDERPQGHFYTSESTSFHKRRPPLRRKPKETHQKPKKEKRPAKSVEKSREENFEGGKGIEESEESSVPKTVTLSKQNKEFYKQRRWPHGVVYYLIDEECTVFDEGDLRRRLSEVNAILRRRTCTRIEEIQQRDANKHADYLVLDNSPDYVTGRVGGRQIFGSAELLVGGQHRQHTAMMVMAMLGFYFEVSRHDRDQYVKVHNRHIRPDKLHHFEKITDEATLPLPYDYKSATHPAWMFWRKLGHKGISSVATYKDKDPDASIMKSFGQHKKLLSEGDIIKINSIYGTKCMKNDDRLPDSE